MFAQHFLDSIHKAIDSFDLTIIDKMAETLAAVRGRGGRLFIVGSGGGAGHASHATNDFRKICGFEAYCPSDNVSELTARINDEGWDVSYSNWLIGSRLRAEDGILVFSVGGGSVNPPVSVNLVKVLQLAKERGASITGIVGRNGGYTAEIADACVVVPTIDEALITPIVEGLQAVVWHLLVSHPALSMNKGRWEELGGSVAKSA
ncbi:MAG: SIS domain-containing protein [Parvibaculaceae bacterium]|nr:SIS domain-containing protein [Parvibaculaceae bacterium]